MHTIVLTGGPCGGKTSLLQAIAADSELASLTACPEEAVFSVGSLLRMPVRDRAFQCAVVGAQLGLERAMRHALADAGARVLLFHRGTLDPCAYWQLFGNDADAFFAMTGTTPEQHYRRYDAVIQMQSTAVGCPEGYVRYPDAHRGETVEEAARLDRLLAEVWSAHPRHVTVRSCESGDDKVQAGLSTLRRLIRELFDVLDEGS